VIENCDQGSSEDPIIVGSREQLLHLLAEAAEIEHTLMCSYLYAVFSLKRRGDPGLTNEQADAVERWRKAILDVAIEEMGHLLIVANLTIAVGGQPHFGRPNFPVAPGYFPSAVTVRLTPFSEETLEHFIFLERPTGVVLDDAAAFEQEDYDRKQRIVGLMPSTQDYLTIAHLYEAIRVNIRALARELGEHGLFLTGTDGQLGPQDIDMAGVFPIATVAAAMQAIDVIVEQGEGSQDDRDDSHYRSFLAVRDQLKALRSTDSAFEPAWPVVDSPVLRTPQEPGDTCYISHPDSARMLDFACSVYGLLLRTLNQTFGRSDMNADTNLKRLLDLSFELMHLLGAASTALARMPANENGGRANAGMTFTMLRGIEPIRFGAVESAVIEERIASIIAAAHSFSALDAGLIAGFVRQASTFTLEMGGSVVASEA
jgi:hypothetical protein